MEYKMIIKRTLFVFKRKGNGILKLSAVRFLQDHEIRTKGRSLYLKLSSGTTQHFVSGAIPMKYLSGDQFCFVAEVARFFRNISEGKDDKWTIWLGLNTDEFDWSGIIGFSDNSRNNPAFSMSMG